MVEVTQEDRDAAAPYANCLRDMQDIFDGKADNLPVVQAFARHRIAHQPQPSAEQATVDSLLDQWDKMRHAIDKVVCSLPSQLSKAVADMVIQQSALDAKMKQLGLCAIQRGDWK